MAKVKVSAKPAPQTTVVYRGSRSELQGRKFRIPSDTKDMAKFIESEYDRQQQEEEAKAQAEEQQRIQAEAEAERIAQAELESEAQDDIPQPV